MRRTAGGGCDDDIEIGFLEGKGGEMASLLHATLLHEHHCCPFMTALPLAARQEQAGVSNTSRWTTRK